MRAKCIAKLERLRELGYQMRRPESDYLRDGIYELRTKFGHVQFRMLYFFHCQVAAVISHGIIKPGAKVDAKEIDLAMDRMKRFKKQPDKYTFQEEE